MFTKWFFLQKDFQIGRLFLNFQYENRWWEWYTNLWTPFFRVRKQSVVVSAFGFTFDAVW